RLGERAAEHREILGENIGDAAVDRAPARDHAVAWDFARLHAEIDAAMLDEHVVFLERSIVEEQGDALAGGQLAPFVLGFDTLDASAQAGFGAAAFKFGDDFFHGANLSGDDGFLCPMPAPY